MKPFLALPSLLLLVLPIVAGEEASPAAPQGDAKPMVMIEAKIYRGTPVTTATLRGGNDALPRAVGEIGEATEKQVIHSPTVLCEPGHIATVRVGTGRVFENIDGEEEIPAGLARERG